MALPSNDKIIGDLGHTEDHNAIVNEILFIKENYFSASSTEINLSNYLTISAASSTYLTIDSASLTYATKESPVFTGVPTAPTAASVTNNTQIATTEFVKTEVSTSLSSKIDAATASSIYLSKSDASSTYAPIDSPLFTGTPLAPTASVGNSSNQIATTEFVTEAVVAAQSGSINLSDYLTKAVASATYAVKDSPVFTGSVTAAQFIGKINYSEILNAPNIETASISWGNITNKPDPVIEVNLLGDITGSASTVLTDLTNGQISINTTIASNSVTLGTDTTGDYVSGLIAGDGITISGTSGEGWSPTISINSTASVSWLNVSSKPSPVIGIALSGVITGSASATLTDLNNSQVTINTSQNIVINEQTVTSYTLQLSDAGKLIAMNNSSTNAIVVPLNSAVQFPIGSKVDITQIGSGTSSVTFTSGVTLNSEGNKKTLNARYSAATLVKMATDTWILIGALK